MNTCTMRAIVWLGAALPLALPAQSELGWKERFAFPETREAALAELVPGTVESYYYTAIHLQNSGQFARVPELMKKWDKQHGQDDRYREIENRQALLEYPQNPQKTLGFLRSHLGLNLHHARETEQAPAQYPATLDPAQIAEAAFLQQALQQRSDLGGVENAGLYRLVRNPISREQRRDLLTRLPLADVAGVTELVIEELKDRETRGFGALPIYEKLLRAQLDAIRQAVAGTDRDLAGNEAFVNLYLAQLAPSADVDLLADPAAHRAYLLAVHRFAQTLTPSQNSLKAAALYNLLDFDRRRGNYDLETFIAYLKLPRAVAYMSRTYLERGNLSGQQARLDRKFAAAPLLPPILDEQPLVRDYLARFLRDAESPRAFAEWIEDGYLKRLFAETKLLAGVGDLAQWVAMIPPGEYQALRNRVDVDLGVANPELFAADAAVSLTLAVKNVDKLRVSVYDIDAFNYYREHGREIDASVDLDCCVPNHEFVKAFKDVPPLTRHVERIELPQVAEPGLYVVEFAGNGVGSRALIRKGRLRGMSRVTSAGHRFSVLDDAGKTVPGASVWMNGQSFAADEEGVATIPFSTGHGDDPFAPVPDDPFAPISDDPFAPSQVILRQGRLASLAPFGHEIENYYLKLGWMLDRESLLAGEEATLILRPSLAVNTRPATLKLIEKPVVEIRFRDVDGIDAVERLEGVELKDDADFVHRLRVPPRVVEVWVSLAGTVRNLSMNRDDAIRASQVLVLNGMLRTDTVEDLFLRCVADGYWLEARGRNGERLPNRALTLTFKHRLFVTTKEITLQGDDAGLIKLGPLAGIERVATHPEARRVWTLDDEAEVVLPDALHLLEGEVIELPAVGGVATNLAQAISLLSCTASGGFSSNLLALAQIKDGVLRIAGLAPGDHRLTWRESQRQVDIRVTRGRVADQMIVGPARGLELTPIQPLQITTLGVRGDTLRLQLLGATPSTRVHLLARRTASGGNPFAGFLEGLFPPDAGTWSWPGVASSYLSGRAMGDETRYVLDRRDAARFPGNLLERPSLLLTPWSKTTTETMVQEVAEDEAWSSVTPAESSAAHRSLLLGRGVMADAGQSGLVEAPPTLDFLPAPARVWANLRADPAGVIEIPLADLGGRQDVCAIAADLQAVASRRVSLPAADWKPRDLRLAKALEPARRFAERKAARGLAAGETLTLTDRASGRVEVYDSLAKVFRLFQSLAPDAVFDEFAFVVEWPALPAAVQEERYGKYACHELNFFLFHKDPAFFKRVVAPFLRNKRDKQFMDSWLLEDDLAGWLVPGKLQELNALELALLARRMPERRDELARQLADRCDLIPPDPARDEMRFQTALRSGGLSGQTDVFSLAFGAENAPGLPAGEAGAAKPMSIAMASVDAIAPADKEAGERLQEPPAPVAAPPAPAADAVRKRLSGRLDVTEAAKRRANVRQLYRAPEVTREWLETHYYQVLREAQTPDRVAVNRFWRDYARQDPAKPFLTEHLAEAAGCLTERLCALAVLDLPFAAKPVATETKGEALLLTVATPAVVFHQQVVETEPAEPPLLVVENFFDAENRYRMEGNQRVDLFVRDEFVAGRVYGTQIVLTNPGSAHRILSLLMQIPEGAIALGGGQATKSVPMQVAPYSTVTHTYTFYFPEAREALSAHYPAGVAEASGHVGLAAPFAFKVVPKATQLDRGSWAYVSQSGTMDEVLAFLERENAFAQSVDLERIAWRMRNPDDFERCCKVLEGRGIFSRDIWGYALMHDNPARIRQLLGAASEPFRLACGGHLQSALLNVDGELFNLYEHREYWPLVNARAHRLGTQRVIPNQAFARQYDAFLTFMGYHPVLGPRERLEGVAYFLLQDRIEEANTQFTNVLARLADRGAAAKGDDTTLQVDYARAWLAFSAGKPAEARTIAEPYKDYGVTRWRDRFRVVLAQADEIAGGAATVQNKDRREEVQNQLGAEAPSLAFTLKGSQLRITARNLAGCLLRLYPIDVELLFSRNPYMGGGQVPGRFTFARPSFEKRLALDAKATETEVELPEAYRRRNLIVELAGEGVDGGRVAYTPNALTVQVVANYGQIRVMGTADGKAVAGAYVKVYSRGGAGAPAAFYKDGYTDLRGLFDYASISTDGLGAVESFAVLVLDDKLGAVIMQAPPPAR